MQAAAASSHSRQAVRLPRAPRRSRRALFAASPRTLKIGYVSPQTGPLAPFGEADRFTIQQMQTVLKNGIVIGGKPYPVSILVKDSQSNPNRAGEVANDLILKDKVDIMLVSGTPETANPVSDVCEMNEMPCVSTVVPWQPWFFGRKGDPKKGFRFTYHFFWGLEDVIAVYTGMWQSVQTNRSVGGLFPNDGDGNAWGDAKLGFPPVLAQKGFTLKDPGRFQSMTQDFSAQISTFKQANAQIVTGVVIPPDAKNFLVQARQQGLKPKVISIGKALLFPTSIEALGDLGDGLSTEVWWSPSHPFKSSLTGQSARQVADDYERVDIEAMDPADRLRPCTVRNRRRFAQACEGRRFERSDSRCRGVDEARYAGRVMSRGAAGR